MVAAQLYYSGGRVERTNAMSVEVVHECLREAELSQVCLYIQVDSSLDIHHRLHRRVSFHNLKSLRLAMLYTDPMLMLFQ
jgi:hypothetical protein